LGPTFPSKIYAVGVIELGLLALHLRLSFQEIKTLRLARGGYNDHVVV